MHGIAPQEMKISMVLGSTVAIKEAVENGTGDFHCLALGSTEGKQIRDDRTPQD